MIKIPPITLHVALEEKLEAQKFTFYRPRTSPRMVLNLTAGSLALLDVECIVTDEKREVKTCF